LVRDQEVEGSNPFAPTTKINNLVLSNPTENANERLVQNHLLAFLSPVGERFILANPEDRYFETAEEKRRYLIERFKFSESLFVLSSEHGKAITFSEAFPLCVAYPAPDFHACGDVYLC
jgi:hypothetical protein